MIMPLMMKQQKPFSIEFNGAYLSVQELKVEDKEVVFSSFRCFQLRTLSYLWAPRGHMLPFLIVLNTLHDRKYRQVKHIFAMFFMTAENFNGFFSILKLILVESRILSRDSSCLIRFRKFRSTISNQTLNLKYLKSSSPVKHISFFTLPERIA